MRMFLVLCASVFISGCSVFGDNGVEDALYTVLASDDELKIELRRYEPMILVSTKMDSDSGNSAFRKLFKYISGANQGNNEIAMTAPVLMDTNDAKGQEIAMTAPVFIDESSNQRSMSFVMPKNFNLANTPKPTDPDVWVSEVKAYKVAAIEFNWTLSDDNVEKHTQILKEWLVENSIEAKGEVIQAAYNGPFTLPMYRKNEVIIEVE